MLVRLSDRGSVYEPLKPSLLAVRIARTIDSFNRKSVPFLSMIHLRLMPTPIDVSSDRIPKVAFLSLRRFQFSDKSCPSPVSPPTLPLRDTPPKLD